MALKRVVPRSLTEAYKKREGDFSPNLVGNQFASDGGTPLLTFGNFAVRSNTEPSPAKNFVLGEWSEYYSLSDINITPEEVREIDSNQIFVKLNYDRNNISRFVYFGNFKTLMEFEVTDIIQRWPASLYVSKSTTVVNTVLSFSYNKKKNQSTFRIPGRAITNKFELDYSQTGEINQNFTEYGILNMETNTEYPIVGFTGATNTNNYVTVTCTGKVFEITGATFTNTPYHLKPNKSRVEKFFRDLSDLQSTLLNRLTSPKFKATFDTPIKTDQGTIVYNTTSFVWPCSDGYNIDIDTTEYTNYLTALFGAVNNFDLTKTDLVARKFVSTSIREFDTIGGGDEETGMKVTKLLRIYGREYDEVKKYIDGISFANVVTYNKKDNTSDTLIKIMAKTLGFDTLLSFNDLNDFDVDSNLTPSEETQFGGTSRGLSSKELDIELWRRLVINAWWLFKSKGTRKVVEFFLRLFGVNECLVELDEFVYLAKDKLDTGDTILQLRKVLGDEGLGDIDSYPFDEYGFPKVPGNTNDFYYQSSGFWYNGGVVDKLTGNNPHFGEYDFGQKYVDRFRCFIDGFEPIENVTTTETIETNFFTEGNDGTFSPESDGTGVPEYGTTNLTYLNDTTNQGLNIISSGVVTASGNNGPNTGSDIGDDYSLRITFTISDNCTT